MHPSDSRPLKPCPFCGGKGIIKEDETDNPNDGYSGFPYIVVHCTKCHASAESVSIEYFRQLSTYTVDDFRKSHALRAKEEARSDAYIAKKKEEAVLLWNQRA